MEYTWFNILVAVVAGMIAGSFLNVVAYRIPRGESIVFPPSRCPYCGHRIRARDLVPVVSWLWLRGRCRDCGAPISWQYPLVEGATGLLWAWVSARFGWSWETVLGLAFVGFLIPLVVIDLREMILPDELTYPLAAVVLAGRLWIGTEPWGWYAGGAFLGAGVLLLLRWLSPLLFGKEGMGLGDVKLMVGLGGMTGFTGAVLTLVLASVAGLIMGLGLQAAGRLREGRYLPFGPFLAVGALTAWLYGDGWITWYMHLWS
ncbi:MAG: prepilin peptidase [Kyrpidia sp.]|nr:prepilin peptidase [Kyrpidia sp.]